MHTELPCLPLLGTARAPVGPQCIRGASPWLQRSHIQRDETKPAKRASRDWKKRSSQPLKTRLSASAMVLARKRKCNEQRKLLSRKKQSDGSDNNAGESERESLDMEEELTAFVEYNATDMDSLDINPSQDFNGEEEQDTATPVSQHMQSSSWNDVMDVDQFQDEASEVFDNVIYAPWSTSIASAGSKSIQGKHESVCPFYLKKATTIPDESVVHDSLSDDSEGSLSDGFDIAINLVRAVKPTVQPSSTTVSTSSTSPNVAPKAQWRQRRSVKRDCSLIDNSSNDSVTGRVLLAAPHTPVPTNDSSSDRVIELKDGCFDSSDDAQEVWSNEVSCSVLSFLRETRAAVSSSVIDPPSLPNGFQPRLARKRRKVDQLTLDGFFRPKTH